LTARADLKHQPESFLAAQQSGLPTAFVAKAKAIITCVTVIFTDQPVDPTTQTPPRFQIIRSKDKPSATTK
jgi:hypothetical protein